MCIRVDKPIAQAAWLALHLLCIPARLELRPLLHLENGAQPHRRVWNTIQILRPARKRFGSPVRRGLLDSKRRHMSRRINDRPRRGLVYDGVIGCGSDGVRVCGIIAVVVLRNVNGRIYCSVGAAGGRPGLRGQGVLDIWEVAAGWDTGRSHRGGAVRSGGGLERNLTEGAVAGGRNCRAGGWGTDIRGNIVQVGGCGGTGNGGSKACRSAPGRGVRGYWGHDRGGRRSGGGVGQRMVGHRRRAHGGHEGCRRADRAHGRRVGQCGRQLRAADKTCRRRAEAHGRSVHRGRSWCTRGAHGVDVCGGGHHRAGAKGRWTVAHGGVVHGGRARDHGLLGTWPHVRGGRHAVRAVAHGWGCGTTGPGRTVAHWGLVHRRHLRPGGKACWVDVRGGHRGRRVAHGGVRAAWRRRITPCGRVALCRWVTPCGRVTLCGWVTPCGMVPGHLVPRVPRVTSVARVGVDRRVAWVGIGGRLGLALAGSHMEFKIEKK
mmetsp:Transcript_53257/g.88591  ORF Transcript_53257/g.88591 Transcript_53257/m.88591 type:complete len:489 (+) Transcript_53257:989-2455(+)